MNGSFCFRIGGFGGWNKLGQGFSSTTAKTKYV